MLTNNKEDATIPIIFQQIFEIYSYKKIKIQRMQHDPLPPSNSPHNFGPATARDDLVYGSFRPAFSEATEKANSVEDADVAVWTAFMKENGVKRIICLLNDDEMNFYK